MKSIVTGNESEDEDELQAMSAQGEGKPERGILYNIYKHGAGVWLPS